MGGGSHTPHFGDLLRGRPFENVGLNPTRADAINPNALGRVPRGQRLGELQSTGLGNVIAKGACSSISCPMKEEIEAKFTIAPFFCLSM